MDKCQRCSSKKAIVNCMQCEKFRALCERCDAYVHNLPGKKEHNRVNMFQNEQQGVNSSNVSNKGQNVKENHKGMVMQSRNNNENEQLVHNEFDNNNNMNNNAQINNYVIPSLINRNNEKGMNVQNERFVPQYQEEQQFNYFNNANVINNSNNIMDNNNNNNIMINSNSSQITNDNNNNMINNLISSNSERNKPFSYSSIYSRDYLAELKSTYAQDQIDFQCQGSSLRSSLEKIRLSFNEQLKLISSQLEQYEQNQDHLLKSQELKHKDHIYSIIKEKDSTILSLTEQIKTLEHQNTILNNELTHQNETFHQKIADYELRLQTLETQLLKKEEELQISKNQIDTILAQNESSIQNETNRLMNTYETKIHQILNSADQSREQLLKIINERETDIKNLVNTHRDENDNLINTVKGLKEQNDDLTYQISRMNNEKEQIEKNILDLNAEKARICDEYVKKENAVVEIEEMNIQLKNENDSLRQRVNKLETIIYGKGSKSKKV